VDDPQVVNEDEGIVLTDHMKNRVKTYLLEKAQIRASRRPHKLFPDRDVQGRKLPKEARPAQREPEAKGLDYYKELSRKRPLHEHEVLEAMEAAGLKDFMRGR